jgi:hypothetical protein
MAWAPSVLSLPIFAPEPELSERGKTRVVADRQGFSIGFSRQV